MLTDAQIIKKYSNSKKWLHISKSPLKSKACYTQSYITGYNTGGRPDGIWLSRGSAWMQKALELNTSKHPVCCHLYQITLKDNINLYRISDDKSFDEFDRKYEDYWLNMDYIQVDFFDYVKKQNIRSRKLRELDFKNMVYCDSLKNMLVYNKLIFLTPNDAIANTVFFKSRPPAAYKYKNWDQVAHDYDGINFERWNVNDRMMENIWYQSLDIPSVCVWNWNAVDSILPLYEKNEFWRKSSDM